MSIFRLLRLNGTSKYPVGDRLYYRSDLCGEYISSVPAESTQCSCGNLAIDVPAYMLSERRKGTSHLVRKIA